MLRFFPLKIIDVRSETASAVSIAFEVPPHWKRMYRFKQGQYLTLRANIGGREIRRAYSICSGVNDPELRIAIKRIEGGRFSTYVHERLHVGAMIDVMPPHGRFFVPVAPDRPRTYVLCATGSGITPILSILKTVLAAEPHSRVALFYGNRTLAEIMFHAEVARVAADHPGRLVVSHFLSRESAAGFHSGRLDERVLPLVEQALGPIAELDACFLCGVSDMTATLSEALRRASLPESRIHVELFSGSAVTPEGALTNARATILIGGKRFEVELGGRNVLDAALDAGIDLPYACRVGSCSSCICKIRAGRVQMVANNALDPSQVAEGYALTCQAWALTQEIVVDCDVE